MQTISPTELKRGMVLMIEGAPQILDDFHITGTAQTKHKIHGKLRNLKTGRIVERVFTENERVVLADLTYRRVVYTYKTEDQYVFTDAETFEEYSLHKDQIGERHWFVKEDEEYKAIFLEGKFMDIVLPPSIPLKVVETGPSVRGGSDSTWKPAKLETGLEIMLPLFIETGEIVRVDTSTRKYVGKESSSNDKK